MKIALIITIWTAQTSSADLRSYFLEQQLAFLKAQPEVVSVDLFVPDPGDVTYPDDSTAPALMIQINMSTAANAKALIKSEEFLELIVAESAYGAPIKKLALDVVETVNFPIPGHKTRPPRTAPLSFIVRYSGPTDDEAAFVRFYTENHTPILATFPEIRNVFCYLPLDWRSTKEVADSELILINEVVFDDIDALNRALESDVMTPLKADGRQFAKFGFNTHHAMRRERIFAGGED